MKRKHLMINRRNATLLALALATGNAMAITTGTWNSTSAGDLSPGTWTGGTPNGEGDVAQIYKTDMTSGNKTWNVNTSITIGVLSLNVNRTANFNSTNSGVLIFDNTGTTAAQINVNNLGTGSQNYVINAPIQLNNSLNITNSLPAGDKSLTLGAISSTNGALTITNTSANHATTTTTRFNGVISDGSGSISFVNSNGYIQLTAANNYSGGTTISGGTLSVSASNNLGAAASNLVIDGGTLQIAGITLTNFSGIGHAVSFTSGKTVGMDINLGLNTFVADQVLNQGSGGLTKTGAGNLVLNQNNTYTGNTTVTAGTLLATKAAALPGYNSSGKVVFNGGTVGVQLGGAGWTTAGVDTLLTNATKTSGALGIDTTNGSTTQWAAFTTTNFGSTLGLTKLGTGTLTLNQTNTYTGATTVNGGTLLLDKSVAGAAIASTSALTLGGGTLSIKGANSGITTQTLAALSLSAGTDSTIKLDSNSGTSTTLTLANSAPTRGANSTLAIDLSIANTVLASTLGLTAAAQTTTQAILGYATVKDSTGTGFAANVGGNIVRYTGADVLTNSSNSGTTNYRTAPTGTSTTGSPYLTGAASPSYNSLSIDTSGASGANFLSLNGTVTLGQKAVLMTGAQDFTIQSGTLGANNSEVIVHQLGTGNLTISSAVSGGTGSLTKDGSGTLTIGGTNTYTGLTTVSNGMLLVNNTSGSGTGTGAVSVGGGLTVATLGGTGSISGAVAINNLGILSPGASIESLTTGALTLNNGSTFAYEMNSTSVTADLLKVSGNVILNGTVNLALDDLAAPDAAFAPGTKFSLINYTGSLNGGFFYGVPLGEGDSFLAGLNNWTITYSDADGGMNFTGEYFGGADKFVNLTLTAIPEPGSWLALGCLIGSGTFLRRRNRGA